MELKRAAISAIENRQPESIQAVLRQLEQERLFFPGEDWTTLADAAATTADARIIGALWNGAGDSRGHFRLPELERLAYASVTAANAEVLAEVLSAIYAAGFYLEPKKWADLVKSAMSRPDANIAHCLWKQSAPSREALRAVNYGWFASLAAAVKDIALLETVFDCWQPSSDTLGGEFPEHPAWGAFFAAAQSFNNEPLIFKIFCRLETFYDPVRYQNRGTLQEQLKGIRSRLQNRALANEMTAIMHGDRWDLTRFFLTLNAYPPNSDITATAGRFEGAARCLMQWLINRFFADPPEKFEGSLCRVVDGMMTLPRNRPAAFIALLSRGHQNYGGNMLAAYRRLFSEHLAFLEPLSDEDLVNKIRDGTVTNAIGCFDDSCKSVIPYADEPPIPPGCKAERLLDAVEYIAKLCGDSIDNQRADEKSGLWVKLKSLCETAEIEGFQREDWLAFLRRLLWKVSWEVANRLRFYIAFQAHNLKDQFYSDFQRPMCELGLSEDERRELANYARAFLLNAQQRLRSRRLGNAIPINFTSRVKECLSPQVLNFGGAWFEEPDGKVSVLAWEGASQDIIEPMLRELAFNCAKALAAVPLQQRFLRIRLEKSRETEAAFALLTVTSPIPESQIRHPRSTKMGLRYIRRMAGVLLGDPTDEAAASFEEKDDPTMGRKVFVSRIRFPLAQSGEPQPEPKSNE